MKIAFDNTLPDKSKITNLIESSGLESHWGADRFYDASPDQCRYVSAYDGERLVGLGRFVKGDGAADSEIDGRLDIVVLPDYRSRDIVGTIFKLLRSRAGNPLAGRKS